MAKVQLDSTDANRKLFNNGDDVFGTNGIDSAIIQAGTAGVTIEQDVEQVSFKGSLADFSFQQAGNNLKVYSLDGKTLISTIIVQADGTDLTFNNGTVKATFDTTGSTPVLKIGDKAISSTSAVQPQVSASSIDTAVTTEVTSVVDGQMFNLKQAQTIAGEKYLAWGDASGANFVNANQVLDFLQNVVGLDLYELDLVKADGTANLNSVQNIALTDANATADRTLTITTNSASGSASVGAEYVNLVQSLILDINKSRLSVQNDTPAQDVATTLTTAVNNGGTIEAGFTTPGDDVIVAGRPDLVHGAYIDGGAGEDTLKIEMKGPYAQPVLLKSIETIVVANAAHVYDPVAMYNSPVKAGYPLLDNAYSENDPSASALDLTNAIDLKKLVVTEQFGMVGVNVGKLVINGIQNNATARLEGEFENTSKISLHYGDGAGVNAATGVYEGINLQLQLGSTNGLDLDVTGNASIVNIEALGFENAIESALVEHLRVVNVSGTGSLYIAQPLTGFNAARPAVINAAQNSGGVELTLSSAPVITPEVLAKPGVREVRDEFGNVITAYVAEVAPLPAVYAAGPALSEVVYTGSKGNDEITINNADAVTITSGNGASNKFVVDVNNSLSFTGGAGGNDLTIWGDADGVLLNIANADVVRLGSVAGPDDAVFARQGSAINAATIVVSDPSDLTEAALTGVTSIVIDNGCDLRITDAQLKALGANVFVANHAPVAQFDDAGTVTVEVTSSTTLDALLNGTTLDSSINFNFVLFGEKTTLTLSAQQLTEYVAPGGIDVSTTTDGKIVVTNASTTFDAIKPVAGEGNIVSGTDVTVLTVDGGFDRPDTKKLAVELDVTANNTTVKDFDKLDKLDTLDDTLLITKVIGTGTAAAPIRVNVEFADDGQVGTAGNANGLDSKGVQSYVVTKIAADGNDDVIEGNVGSLDDFSDGTMFVCDNTVGLKELGLRGNSGAEMTFKQINHGVSLLLEGDGSDAYPTKAAGNPNFDNIGKINANYFFDGADAVVNINNQGVELTAAGGARSISAEGINITNADKITINVADGDTIIQGISAVSANSVELVLNSTNSKDVTLHLDAADNQDFASINAAGVTGTATLAIDGDMDLSTATLTGVEAVTLANNADLFLTLAQINAIGLANIEYDTLADNNTLSVAVPDGQVVTMTAAEFMSLCVYNADGTMNRPANVFVATGDTGTGILNITGVTQAQIDAGFSLQNVAATVNGTITLAESVELDAATNLNAFAVELATGQTIHMATAAQAEREVNVATGATNTTVDFLFNSLVGNSAGGFDIDQDGAIEAANGNGIDETTLTGSIDLSDYSADLTRVSVRADLIEGLNVEQTLAFLNGDIVLDVYNQIGDAVTGVNRTVTVEANTVVDAVAGNSMIFDDLRGNVRVENLTLNLQGGVQIDGIVDAAESGDLPTGGFQKLTINSTGTAANSIGITDANDTTPNDGNLDDPGNLVATGNNLLDVEINATAALVVSGAIALSSVNANATATVEVLATSTAAVTIADITATVNVQTVNIINNGTGVLTAPGASPALVLNAVDAVLNLSGSGDIVLGQFDDPNTAADESIAGPFYADAGVSGANLIKIDASALTGDLNLGVISKVDANNFDFIAGTGVTTFTLDDTYGGGVDHWTVDMSNAAAGSSITITDATMLISGGKLNIILGTNGANVDVNVVNTAALSQIQVNELQALGYVDNISSHAGITVDIATYMAGGTSGNVIIEDAGVNIGNMGVSDIAAPITQINAIDDVVTFTVAQANAADTANIVFDATDAVTVNVAAAEETSVLSAPVFAGYNDANISTLDLTDNAATLNVATARSFVSSTLNFIGTDVVTLNVEATEEAITLTDAPAATYPSLTDLGNARIDVIDLVDNTASINVANADALAAAGLEFAATDTVTITDTGAAIAGGDIAGWNAANINLINASSAVSITKAQADIIDGGNMVFDATDSVTVTLAGADEAAVLAELSQNTLAGYNAANINNLDAADDTASFNVQTANVIDSYNMVFDASDVATVNVAIDMEASTLVSSVIAGYGAANINVLNLADDAVTVNAALASAFVAAGVAFDASDAAELSDALNGVLTVSLVNGYKDANITAINSTDAVTFNVAVADAVDAANFVFDATDVVTVNVAAGEELATLDAAVINGYGAANINNINLADSAAVINVTVADAVDAQNMVFDATDAIVINVASGEEAATLDVASITGYNDANINAFDLADGAANLTAQIANALVDGNMVFDATDSITVTDAAGIATTDAAHIAGWNTANINLINVATDAVTINATQFNAFVTATLDFDATDDITVNSGAGADTLDFNAIGGDVIKLAMDLVADAADTVANFTVGTDKIVLTKAGVGAFNALAGLAGAVDLGADFTTVANAAALTGGSVAASTDGDAIIFLQDTGALYYNADGAVAGGLTLIGTFAGANIVSTDFVIA